MSDSALQDFMAQEYQYGFKSEIDSDEAPIGISEDIIRLISQKKGEPEYMLEYRLNAFRHWQTLEQPTWSRTEIEPIDFDKLRYYSAPKKKYSSKKIFC